jgi:hypothetical protein
MRDAHKDRKVLQSSEKIILDSRLMTYITLTLYSNWHIVSIKYFLI